MRRLFLICVMLGGIFTVFGQGKVGINTDDPKVTLDVNPFSTDATTAEGIIAPRLTCAQLKAKNGQYGNGTNSTGLDEQYLGTIVYVYDVTDCNNASDPQTIEVKEPGYYVYTFKAEDGTTKYLWRKLDLKISDADLGVEVKKKIYKGKMPDANQVVEVGDLRFRFNFYSNEFQPEVSYNNALQDITPSQNRILGYGMNLQHQKDQFKYINKRLTFTQRERVDGTYKSVSQINYFPRVGDLLLIHMVDNAREFYYRVTFMIMGEDGRDPINKESDKTFIIVVEKY